MDKEKRLRKDREREREQQWRCCVCVLVSKRKIYPLSLQRYTQKKKVVGKKRDDEGVWTGMEGDHKQRNWEVHAGPQITPRDRDSWDGMGSFCNSSDSKKKKKRDVMFSFNPTEWWRWHNLGNFSPLFFSVLVGIEKELETKGLCGQIDSWWSSTKRSWTKRKRGLVGIWSWCVCVCVYCSLKVGNPQVRTKATDNPYRHPSSAPSRSLKYKKKIKWR